MFLTKLYLLSLLCSITFAIPLDGSYDTAKNFIGLARRDPPKEVLFYIDGWEDISEQDCYILLCIRGGNRVFTRIRTKGEAMTQYTDSGASVRPFRGTQANLDTHDVQRINDATISGEECPWRSTQEGGKTAFITSATEQQQSSQGLALGNGYDRAKVAYGDQFRVTLEKEDGSKLGLYCEAYMSEPQDMSVCNKDREVDLFGTTVKLANYVFQKIQKTNPVKFVLASGSGSGLKRSED